MGPTARLIARQREVVPKECREGRDERDEANGLGVDGDYGRVCTNDSRFGRRTALAS